MRIKIFYGLLAYVDVRDWVQFIVEMVKPIEQYDDIEIIMGDVAI